MISERSLNLMRITQRSSALGLPVHPAAILAEYSGRFDRREDIGHVEAFPESAFRAELLGLIKKDR